MVAQYEWVELTTADSLRRFAERHDLDPHPNRRKQDGRPVAERLAKLDSQIRLFQEQFGRKALTVRNHRTVWAAHMEHVETVERPGRWHGPARPAAAGRPLHRDGP